ncbi:MOSC domain-containing protein [Paenibacillus sp. R14(2021)]|uniref:MOSC domain-containing protein n=1 Tax=Paenibacillus sp. R14(2021) TaxID=2859228 RepID=UPI001C614615|nr:MOSC domain-containing protein [Paenibacillus sp. R14(2021)]
MRRGMLLSLNVGMPTLMTFNQKDVTTGIFKTPVYQPLDLYWERFEGDGQADLKHHGGKDKAVCVYSYEHYPFWEKELGRPLAYGAFGENLTVCGLLESEICIGDVYQLGSAIVQVSQPRQPCFKLAARYESPKMPVKVQETGFTGFYFRVLQQGKVEYTDKLLQLSHHPEAVTVAFANRVMHHDRDHIEGVEKLLRVNELSVSWRSTLEKRRAGITIDSSERILGSKQSEQP